MLAADHTVSDTLPALDVPALARRVAFGALLVGLAVVAVLVFGGRIHAVADLLRRLAGLNAGWAAAAVAFECLSLAGYVVLLSLVAGRASTRIGVRESAQITLAGAAATRLLPTAGVGGAALALWALRRAGLSSQAAVRTLLVFLVLLYSMFLSSIVLAGLALTAGVGGAHGPAALSLIPAGTALAAIAAALGLAWTRGEAERVQPRPGALGRLRASVGSVIAAVREAFGVVASADFRLLGAIAYWGLDAAVLWSMLRAFGAHPALPAVVLAYFLGQVANTLPLPGSVSGGIAGVLIAFGAPAAVAVPAVLAYRTIAVWLPTPVAIASVPALRRTVARWGREDAAASVSPELCVVAPEQDVIAASPCEPLALAA